ncbi:MAG: histidinol-phosphatase [Mycobacteriales bacterium]
MPAVSLQDDLRLAHELADAADAISLDRFLAADLVVESKSDRSPVSDADRAVEQALREALAARRPGDAVLGEEEGETGTGPRRWILDPIDGTKNFVRGVPVWATLIALQDNGQVTVGLVSAPALGRRWWAACRLGAHTGGALAGARQLRVSAVHELADASVAYSSLAGWEKQGRLPGLLQLSRDVWRTRAYGDFWSHLLVAEGAVDAAFEPEVSLWDLAPLQVILEEAGGCFTDLSGVARADGGSAVCSNGLLHARILQSLQPGPA